MKNLDQYQLLYNNLWLHKSNPDQRFIHMDKLVKTDSNDEILIKKTPSKPSPSVQVFTETPIAKKEIITHYAKVVKDDTATKPIPVKTTTEESLITDWDTLVSDITNCTKCELCHGRQNVVIERGSRTAKWMFIGEGPGENEDKEGKPFVGAAGALLQKMLIAMKLDPENDVYICNVVKCRPPYNRNPEPHEIDSCKNYLLSQIALVQPKIIVTLGRFAFHTLLNTTAATAKFRGKINHFNDIPLIVTYHPAYLLRNPAAKKDSWTDLQLALQVFGSV